MLRDHKSCDPRLDQDRLRMQREFWPRSGNSRTATRRATSGRPSRKPRPSIEAHPTEALQEGREEIEDAEDQVKSYVLSLAKRVKAIDATLAVWASPYYVGNQTLHTTAASAADYGAYWQRLWSLAPSFDWIGLQDARGWQGNSDKEVAQALAALATAAATEKRELWSNIELFEGWPLPCEYPTKCGRHPAPMARIAKQLASEAPLVSGKHIAWEWTSCLSPYTNADTAQLYKDYTAYLGLPALATNAR